MLSVSSVIEVVTSLVPLVAKKSDSFAGLHKTKSHICGLT